MPKERTAMELELKKEQFACCRALPPLNNTH